MRELIDSGAYGLDDRLPSVRGLSAQMSVSVTTVLEAYRLLEDQGLVEARPQSGYYRTPPKAAHRPPDATPTACACAPPTGRRRTSPPWPALDSC